MSTSDELDAQIQKERLREIASGTGIAARRARYELKRGNTKQHKIKACPQGHPYDENNTHYNSLGRRMCLTCHAAKRVHPDRAFSNSPHYKGKPIIDMTGFTPDAGPYETRD